MMDQLIGKMLDNRYEILSVVGTGGMAIVYKAHCHKLNRLVAIKVLKSDLARDAEFRRRFHDESQAVAMLSNPNIVSVYDVSSSDGLEYIVMELIDGITLKQYMQKKDNKLSWRESLHFIMQIMKALSHAHSRGIIHRDIKPHNIMVLRDGSVKVADFGIARLMSAGQSTLTQEALGSVHYISPEQAKGSHIDERSDIYSAGVVLYEMLTGRLPFEGETAVAVAIQHINSVPLPPRELNPDVPEALEAITLKAMAPNVEKRYPSADAMLVDLEQFRKNPEMSFDFAAVDFSAAAIEEQSSSDETQVVRRLSSVKATSTTKINAARYEDEFDEDEEEPRSWKSTAVAAAAIGIFIVAIIVFLWVTFLSDIINPQTQEHVVPDLLGKLYDEVIADEQYAAFTIEPTTQTVNTEVEPGTILNQSPVADTVLKGSDTTITVEVAVAPDELTMPYLKNIEIREAQNYLKDYVEEYQLEIVIEEQASDTVTVNYVIDTDPIYGTTLKEGQTITIYVSSGPDTKPVTVISYIGMTLDDAKVTLKTNGLKLGTVNEEESSTVEPGYIIRQTIAANEEVAEGTAIGFTVAKAPEEPEVEIPEEPDENSTPVIPITKSIQYPITLPDTPDVVRLLITVGGETVYDTDVNTALGAIAPAIQGSGEQQVDVYIDGVLVKSEMVTFS